MGRLAVAAGLLAGLLAAGCFQAVSNESGLGSEEGEGCTTCRRSTAAGGVSGGGSTPAGGNGSSGGASSAGSTGSQTTVAGGTSSGSSGGSSGGFFGSTSGTFDAGPCSGFLLTSVIEDSEALVTNMADPIAGASVEALDASGVPIGGEATLSNSSGQFGLCVTQSGAFTTQFQAPSYTTTYLEDLDLVGNTSIIAIPLGSSTSVAAYAVVLAGFVETDAVITGEVISASNEPPCNDMSGWVLSVTLPDGGAVSHETAYLGGDGLPTVNQTSTTPLPDNDASVGIGIIFNIDPALTDAVLISASRGDGGGACPVNGSGPFTSRVVIAPSAFSFAPLVVP